MLVEGIKIYNESGSDLPVLVSKGVHIGTGVSTAGLRYDAEAYVPRKPWYDATEQELAKLLVAPGELPKPSESISIVRLPPEAAETLSKYHLYALKTRDEAVEYHKLFPKAMKNARNLMANFASQYLLSPAGATNSSLVVFAPNLETTTTNQSKHTGLHLDNREEMPLELAGEAATRISINLGAQVRYLLFVNQPLKTLYEWVSREKGEAPQHSHVFPGDKYCQLDLYLDFFRLFPDYPVVKIPIQPFEAYIAPTENFIHDGSTEGSTTPDVTFYFRGHFGIPAVRREVVA
jgi:hypothetical protein